MFRTGKHGYEPEEVEVLHAGVQVEKRQEIIERFQQRPLNSKGDQARFGADIGVLVLGSRVGGIGVTLTAARHLVVFEPCSDPALDAQVIKRFHRTGQTRHCTIYRLVASWMGIQGKICDRVEQKKVMTDIFLTEKGV